MDRLPGGRCPDERAAGEFYRRWRDARTALRQTTHPDNSGALRNRGIDHSEADIGGSMGVMDCAACDGSGRTSCMICWFCHRTARLVHGRPAPARHYWFRKGRARERPQCLARAGAAVVLLGPAAGVASVGGASAATATEHGAACLRTAHRMS